MTKNQLPPLREEYKLSEEDKQILERFIEELIHRLGVEVSIDIYTENHLAYPKLDDRIMFKLHAGNWKRVSTISKMELGMSGGQVFYYFLRRLIDDTMADLLRRGAQTY